MLEDMPEDFEDDFTNPFLGRDFDAEDAQWDEDYEGPSQPEYTDYEG